MCASQQLWDWGVHPSRTRLSGRSLTVRPAAQSRPLGEARSASQCAGRPRILGREQIDPPLRPAPISCIVPAKLRRSYLSTGLGKRETPGPFIIHLVRRRSAAGRLQAIRLRQGHPAVHHFVAVFDRAMAAAREIVGMPDRRASLFVGLCLQNNGQLVKSRRVIFQELDDPEIAPLEAAVRNAIENGSGASSAGEEGEVP